MKNQYKYLYVLSIILLSSPLYSKDKAHFFNATNQKVRVTVRFKDHKMAGGAKRIRNRYPIKSTYIDAGQEATVKSKSGNALDRIQVTYAIDNTDPSSSFKFMDMNTNNRIATLYQDDIKGDSFAIYNVSSTKIPQLKAQKIQDAAREYVQRKR